MTTSVALSDFSITNFTAPITDAIQKIINKIRTAPNPQAMWQQECKKAYDAKDWDRLWWILKLSTIGSPFMGKKVASFMLDRFLTKGGDIDLDYTFAFPGQSDWISKATSTKAVVNILDNQAKPKIMAMVKSGQTSGFISIRGDVVTDSARDGDLYYALGKFRMDGQYKFNVENEWFGGKKYLKIERVYAFSDVYDWDPSLKGGILPHAYPHALIGAGKAKVFKVTGKFGEPEFKIPF